MLGTNRIQRVVCDDMELSFAGSPLPPASLHLLVPPVRLMSAFMWQVVQQQNVMLYDKLADFISLVTEIVPELLSPIQKAQLTLGLRARVRVNLLSLYVAVCDDKVELYCSVCGVYSLLCCMCFDLPAAGSGAVSR